MFRFNGHFQAIRIGERTENKNEYLLLDKKKKLFLNGITIWQRAIEGVRVGHPDISHPDHDGLRKSERCCYLGG
jgi:hypothetical protein